MKLYVVYYQDYEDVKIKGIFSTKEIALSIIKKYDLLDFQVLEFNLDEICVFITNDSSFISNQLFEPHRDNDYWLKDGSKIKAYVKEPYEIIKYLNSRWERDYRKDRVVLKLMHYYHINKYQFFTKEDVVKKALNECLDYEKYLNEKIKLYQNIIKEHRKKLNENKIHINRIESGEFEFIEKTEE